MLPQGSILGDYKIVARLGSGSFGNVYRATSCSDGKLVALKVCRAQDSEAAILRTLKHPGIVSVIEQFESKHGHVTVMSHVAGISLAAILTAVHRQSRRNLRVRDALQRVTESTRGLSGSVPDGNLGPQERFADFSCRIVLQLAQILEHAHSRGVFHRDVKPENILLNAHWSAVLIDWGVAGGRIATRNAVGGTVNYLTNDSLREIAGLGNLSVDQEPLSSHHDDLFALGIVLFELLTGELPFAPPPGDNSVVVAAREALAQRPSLISTITQDTRIPAALRLILVACVASNEDARYAGSKRYAAAAELAEDLRCYQSRRRLKYVAEDWPSRVQRWWQSRRGFWIGTAGLLLITGIIFATDRYRTAAQLAEVNVFRQHLLSVGVADAVVPVQVETALFESGLFPDSQSLQRQRAKAAHGLAAAYLQYHAPQSAVDLLERAIPLSPGDGQARNDLGAALFQLGEFQHAVEVFSAALQLDCDHVVVLSNRGAAFAAMGDSVSARNDFSQALIIDPQNVAAQKRLKLLESHSGDFVQ